MDGLSSTLSDNIAPPFHLEQETRLRVKHPRYFRLGCQMPPQRCTEYHCPLGNIWLEDFKCVTT